MITCQKHGLQPIVYTSHFVQNACTKNLIIGEELLCVKSLITFTERLWYFYSDEEFLKSLEVGFERFDNKVFLADMDEEKSLDVFANAVPVCLICYDDFLTKNNLVSAESCIEDRN